MTIRDIEDRENLQLVTDSQDVEAIKEYLGSDIGEFDLDGIDGFFVSIKDGDYSEILGFNGSIPYLDKELYQL